MRHCVDEGMLGLIFDLRKLIKGLGRPFLRRKRADLSFWRADLKAGA